MNSIAGWGFIPVALPFSSPVGGASAGASLDAFSGLTQPGTGGDFAGSVRSARTSGEKRDLLDAYASGFIAASRSNGSAAPSYAAPSSSAGYALPVGLVSSAAALPSLGGIENARREAFAGVMEGFQHFAGLVDESALPEDAKNGMLDGLAGLMQQLSGLANIFGQPSQPAVQYPPLPSAAKASSASDVWSHEAGEDGTAKIRLGDKYTLDVKEGDQSFTIRNNETGHSTRIWGDPHVDKDADGKNDFDFKKDMTFVLEDGTKISVNTVDAGNGTTFSSGLTITKGDNAIQVSGLAGDTDGANNLKVVQSNAGETLDALDEDGAQLIYERDNNWVDASGRTVDQSVINGAENAYA